MITDLPAVTVGIDFGTLSGRAVVVTVADGTELGSAVHEYRHGVVDAELPDGGPKLPPDWALQVPQDWRDVLRHAVPEALAAAGVRPEQVIGVGTDFTACTVLPVTADGTPLCELPALRRRPHAYPKLWRHHAAQPQADRINRHAAREGRPWLARYGGRISSEWEYAKALQLLEEDPEVYALTERWIEAADWIVWELTGAESRNLCTAGYKGIHQDGRRPDADFLAGLDPGFAGFTAKLDHPLSPLGAPAGALTARAAAATGLPPGIPVAVGNVDAHVTSAAARALDPGHLLAIMGTSTCHILNSDVLADVPGMCGVVRDGVVPGLWGYEAGQSGVGDIFAWAARTAVPESYAAEARAMDVSVHELLTEKAAAQPVGAHGLLALDWHSGNRSVLVDHSLSGLIVGLTLDTRPEDVYRALLEATAFGTRTVVEAFERAGVAVTEFTAAGGLLRNAFLMQLYSDVLERPVNVIDSAQGPALGSAIHAAVAAGAHPDIRAASAAMGRIRRAAYRPDPDRAAAYRELYREYQALHDHFGRGGSSVMHRLRELRRAATAG
ncbi:ribulokinase [Streptantibioticus cattleyicolor]|uniref:Ribulokinase n=1 Tax=Streptantibioticus cattleyicolor (strain ATCC 35852 / DSM 46488 / JCM 4925 / NBRC 14057 / NRRL 8057) TaxID=1003195 RepID=F8JJB6_STREN|nr:ribulokinase [Streptantibioticus cattleyicolor]AEW98772.1 L-ribulokinase [Streptantibioticus cattleyicolor NRRL 8057 = DSM 46488]AIS36088.1 Ribulokinase [Shuttle vector pASC8057]CCB72177.1 L-ribulokinase [Streptantibioticus cattleyicolor NRRL 8057 = DSM 46488]